MNKIYDLRINTNGNVELMNDGFFEHTDNLISEYKEENYMILEGKYRVSKSDYNDLPHHRKAIDKFLSR